MSPGSEIVPCRSTLDSDKITSILAVQMTFQLKNGRLDYGLLNGYQNVFHMRFDEEKLIQYPFQANGL